MAKCSLRAHKNLPTPTLAKPVNVKESQEQSCSQKFAFNILDDKIVALERDIDKIDKEGQCLINDLENIKELVSTMISSFSENLNLFLDLRKDALKLETLVEATTDDIKSINSEVEDIMQNGQYYHVNILTRKILNWPNWAKNRNTDSLNQAGSDAHSNLPFGCDITNMMGPVRDGCRKLQEKRREIEAKFGQLFEFVKSRETPPKYSPTKNEYLNFFQRKHPSLPSGTVFSIPTQTGNVNSASEDKVSYFVSTKPYSPFFCIKIQINRVKRTIHFAAQKVLDSIANLYSVEEYLKQLSSFLFEQIATLKKKKLVLDSEIKTAVAEIFRITVDFESGIESDPSLKDVLGTFLQHKPAATFLDDSGTKSQVDSISAVGVGLQLFSLEAQAMTRGVEDISKEIATKFDEAMKPVEDLLLLELMQEVFHYSQNAHATMTENQPEITSCGTQTVEYGFGHQNMLLTANNPLSAKCCNQSHSQSKEKEQNFSSEDVQPARKFFKMYGRKVPASSTVASTNVNVVIAPSKSKGSSELNSLRGEKKKHVSKECLPLEMLRKRKCGSIKSSDSLHAKNISMSEPWSFNHNPTGQANDAKNDLNSEEATVSKCFDDQAILVQSPILFNVSLRKIKLECDYIFKTEAETEDNTMLGLQKLISEINEMNPLNPLTN